MRLEGIAKRAQVAIGEMQMEAFRMPDGKYRPSQSGAGEAIAKPKDSFVQFLQGKLPEASYLEGLTFVQIPYESHHIPAKTILIAEQAKDWRRNLNLRPPTLNVEHRPSHP